MISITQEEFDQLRCDQKRFQWLLRIWANVTGEKVADVVRDIDELRNGRVDLADWGNRLMPQAMPTRRSRRAYGSKTEPINLARNGEN